MKKNYLLIEVANHEHSDEHREKVENGEEMLQTHETQIIKTMHTRLDTYSDLFRHLIELHIKDALYARLIVERSRDVKEWIYDSQHGISSYQKKNVDICQYLQSESCQVFLQHCRRLKNMDTFGTWDRKQCSEEQVDEGIHLLKNTQLLIDNAVHSCNSQNALFYVEEAGLMSLTTKGLSSLFYQDDFSCVVFEPECSVISKSLAKIQNVFQKLVALFKSDASKTRVELKN